ncbi:PAS domain S-box protein [Echinimonas agarilytica]|uniref:histidine kinase n=1 Tax=Echinimonas agarilytica TaxID=1215918 RepID=A0AA41W6H0_9GAMM|nr:PAS domain S-box protein [Echinimonas agarilytica]MCM2679547.1 PAS domain S-box protein [Echinimonas agarilytica]
MKVGFRVKTIIGIAVIESILLGVLVFGGLQWLRESNEQQLIRYGHMMVKTLAVTSKDVLEENDRLRVNAMVQEVIGSGDISYIRFIDSKGSVWAQAGVGNQFELPPARFMLTPTQSEDGMFHVTNDIKVDGSVVGRIELGINVQSFRDLMGNARSYGASIAILEVVLVALFSFLLGTFLTLRLRRLRNAARQISEAGPGVQVEVKGHDELSEVTQAFNQMSLSLEASHKEFKSSLEVQLRLSELLETHRAMLRATISSALDAVITIDHNGRVVEYNESAERIFGFTRNEMIGVELADKIIPEAMREAHKSGMKRFRQTGKSNVLGQRLELTALNKKGHEFPCELAIRHVEVGDETLFTAFMRDISERRRFEQELSLAAHAFDANEAIFITDKDANIVRVNNAFTRITGYESDEVLGQNPRILASGELDDDFYDVMWAKLHEDGRWSGEVVNRRKNGELLPELLSISSVKTAAGDITHYVAHFTDLSEQKAVEVSLRQARSDAEAASEAKSRFLATMSHEIRTPLNAILNMNQLLGETSLSHQQHHLVKTAGEAGHTLMALVNNVLDFSRIEAGKIELVPEWFSVSETTQSLVDLFEATASQKRLILTLSLEHDMPVEFYGDALRYRQIVLNLLGNAVKFTQRGFVEVSLYFGVESGLTLQVKDSGPGIDKAAQKRLFDEFYQVDDSKTRHHSGTGLGLAITRQLVSMMDGTIELHSQLGQGTTFVINLPLPSRQKEADIERPKEPAPVATGQWKPHVLLVEDSASNRAVAAEVLGNYVETIEFAENGHIAVEKAQILKYDLILMDVAMPIMDGLEATFMIRCNEGPNQQTPILAMTANAFEEDKQACLSAGMDDFLTKPLDINLIRQKVVEWGRVVSDKYLEVLNIEPQEKDKEIAVLATDSNSEEPPLLDVAVLDRLIHDASHSVVLTILSTLTDEAQGRVKCIINALEQDFFEQITLESHTLKSSLGSFGAKRLQDLALQIEKASKEENMMQLSELVPQLQPLLEQSIAAIGTHMENVASA